MKDTLPDEVAAVDPLEKVSDVVLQATPFWLGILTSALYFCNDQPLFPYK